MRDRFHGSFLFLLQSASFFGSDFHSLVKMKASVQFFRFNLFLTKRSNVPSQYGCDGADPDSFSIKRVLRCSSMCKHAVDAFFLLFLSEDVDIFLHLVQLSLKYGGMGMAPKNPLPMTPMACTEFPVRPSRRKHVMLCSASKTSSSFIFLLGRIRQSNADHHDLGQKDSTDPPVFRHIDSSFHDIQ